MSMIPEEVIEQVRESADILGIIGESVDLKRTGADWRGPCPFHGGKGRNFAVIPTMASARDRDVSCFDVRGTLVGSPIRRMRHADIASRCDWYEVELHAWARRVCRIEDHLGPTH